MPSGNILVTAVSMLTFLLLLNISLAIKCNRRFFHSLHILVSIFLWVTIFCQTYQHSLALSGTLVLYECVCSQPHTPPVYPWGKCPDYQLNRRLDGPEIWPGSPVEVKNFLTLPEPNLNYPFQSTAYWPQLHYHSSTVTVSLILNMCHVCKRLFLQQPLVI